MSDDTERCECCGHSVEYRNGTSHHKFCIECSEIGCSNDEANCGHGKQTTLFTDGGTPANGTEQLPDCDWCEGEIHRLNGNVDIDLCATCLHKGQCGYAPDKDLAGRHVDTGTDGGQYDE